MTRTVAEAIAHTRLSAANRTRYEGWEPRIDELLLREIDRLQAELDAANAKLKAYRMAEIENDQPISAGLLAGDPRTGE